MVNLPIVERVDPWRRWLSIAQTTERYLSFGRACLTSLVYATAREQRVFSRHAAGLHLCLPKDTVRAASTSAVRPARASARDGGARRHRDAVLHNAGSPSITISLTQAHKQHPYFAYLHQYFAKIFRDNLKKETIVIGSNYSVFGKGKNKLQAVNPEHSALLAYGAHNIAKGYTDTVALGRQSLADPLLPLKLREDREHESNFCSACENCLELLIQQIGRLLYL